MPALESGVTGRGQGREEQQVPGKRLREAQPTAGTCRQLGGRAEACGEGLRELDRS